MAVAGNRGAAASPREPVRFPVAAALLRGDVPRKAQETEA